MKKYILFLAVILSFLSTASCDFVALSLSSQLTKIAYPADKYFSLDKQIFEFDAPYDTFYVFNQQDSLIYLLMISDYSSYLGQGDFKLYTMNQEGYLLSVKYLTNMGTFAKPLAFTVTADYTGTKQFTIKNGYLYFFNNTFLVQYNLSNDTQTRKMTGLNSCYIYNNSDIYILSNQTGFFHFSADAGMTLQHQWPVPASTLGGNIMSVIGNSTDIYIARHYTEITRSECKSYSMTGVEQFTSDEIDLVYDFIQGDPVQYYGSGLFKSFNSRFVFGPVYGFASDKVDGFTLERFNCTFPTGGTTLYVTAHQTIGDKVRIYRYTIPQ